MSPSIEVFERAVLERAVRVGVVGLGAVGLQVARVFVEAGFEVIGYDVDAAKVARIRWGETPLFHLGAMHVSKLLASGRFTATSDVEAMRHVHAAILCVPTPLDRRGEPDLSCVRAASRALAPRLAPGALVVLESTSYPGTTREVVGAAFLEYGREPGRDCWLAYSPEREDPGRDVEPRAIPKLAGGTCAASTRAVLALYGAAWDRVVPVRSAEVAEAAKLFENVYRAVNIALANELSIVCDALDIDVRDVLDAAATKPFGFQKFAPGPGVGGHCIPVNPHYFAWIARVAGERARLVEAAAEINESMPARVVERVRRALERRGIDLAGARVLVLGVAYKPGVDVVAGSPGLAIVELLREAGALARWSDPHASAPADPSLASARSDDLSPEALASFDAVVLATPHASFAALDVARHARVFVDATHGTSRAARAPLDVEEGGSGDARGADEPVAFLRAS